MRSWIVVGSVLGCLSACTSSNTLSGPSALTFSPSFAGFASGPYCTTAPSGEGGGCIDGGTLLVFLTDANLAAQCASDGGLTLPPNAHLLELVVFGDGGPVAVGSYTIPDPALGGLPINQLAEGTVLANGNLPTNFPEIVATSGTVQISGMGATVTGTFTAQMDGGAAGSLTGAFDALPCQAASTL